jgi:hypothetical protein
VLRRVFNKATVTMTDFLTSTMCLLGEMIPLLQLLYLQRLVEIAAEKNSTTIFSIPY